MAQDPARHRQLFVEFAQLELDTGGPDPHMAIIGGADLVDHMPWLIGCYVARYTVASAVALANGRWWDSRWHEEHKDGLPIRRERRAVYPIGKTIACLQGLNHWIQHDWPRVKEAKSYEEAWKQVVSKIPYFGRYASIKFLEGLHRYAGFPHAMPDIRPGGAWSPILTLNLLQLEPLPDKSPNLLVNAVAEKWRLFVQSMLVGHELDYFRYETLLCNYRQALEGKYPGRPHDTELKYWIKAQQHWGYQLDDWLHFYGIRARLFNHRFLGEKGGWNGPREELEDTIVKHGYFWSDKIYNYKATSDLAAPVPW